jgi:hypothetical protein
MKDECPYGPKLYKQIWRKKTQQQKINIPGSKNTQQNHHISPLRLEHWSIFGRLLIPTTKTYSLSISNIYFCIFW